MKNSDFHMTVTHITSLVSSLTTQLPACWVTDLEIQFRHT